MKSTKLLVLLLPLALFAGVLSMPVAAQDKNKPAKEKRTETAAKRAESKADESGREYMVGSKGGCYYLNSSGKKSYVDKKYCENTAKSPASETGSAAPSPAATLPPQKTDDETSDKKAPAIETVENKSKETTQTNPNKTGADKSPETKSGDKETSPTAAKTTGNASTPATPATEAADGNKAPATETADTKETKTEPAKKSDSNGGGSNRKYITGPRGGCYYINSSGRKTYVDKDKCSLEP